MSIEHFFGELKSLIIKWEATPVIGPVVADAVAIESVAWTYLKANGLQDLYQIALLVVGAALPGASWVGTVAAVEAQAVADGKALITGAASVAAAQAQADLIAAGKLLPPVNAPAA